MPKIEYTTPSKVTNEATKELINTLHRHIAGTNSAYSTYNVERDRNKGLYTEAALAAQAAQAQESGRRAVAQQMEDTRAAVLAEIEKMRSALYAWIAEPANPDFLVQLRTYHDFDLRMEQIEIEAMAEQAAGNFVALRCLNAVAEKSGFHVNTPTLPDYIKDLDTIQRGFDALYLYAPQGDGHSTDLLPNKNYRGIDYGRPTSTDVSIAVAGAKALEGTLREIQERWSAHVQPTITKTEDLPADEVKDIVSATARKTPDAVTVDQSGTEAEDEARRMGAEMAEANRKANEGLQYYINGGRSV